MKPVPVRVPSRRTPPGRAVAALTAAALALSTGATLAAASASPASPVATAATYAPDVVAAATAPVVPGVTQPVATGRTVTLVTGDRAFVRDVDGRPAVTVLRAQTTGAGKYVNSFLLGSKAYVMPAAAKPYLGRYLDPSLFEVSSPKAATNGRIEVRLSYSGTATPVLPGLTVTSAANGTATGYLTADSAKAFGAALARQVVADSEAGWPARSSLFGSITNIRSVTAGTPVTPSYPMRTMVVRAVDGSGAAVPFAFALYINTVDARLGSGMLLIDGGEGRVSAPAGHYAMVASVDSWRPDGTMDSRVVTLSDIDFRTHMHTVTLDARKATSVLSLSTSSPAVVDAFDLTIQVADEAEYGTIAVGWVGSPYPLRLAPAPEVRGTLRQFTTIHASDAAGSSFAIDALDSKVGVPANQRHVAPPMSQMHAVPTQYHSEIGPTRRGVGYGLLTREMFGGFSTSQEITAPLTRTQYFAGPEGTVRFAGMVTSPMSMNDPGFLDYTTPAPIWVGRAPMTEWFGSPMSLGPPDAPVGSPFRQTLACRTKDRLLYVAAPRDTERTHELNMFADPSGEEVAHLKVWRDGALLADAADHFGMLLDTTGPMATYRYRVQVDRRLQDPVLSTQMVTDVTFRSSAWNGRPVADPACPAGSQASALAVLTATVDLGPGARGVLRTGTSRIGVTVGHPALSYRPEVTRATLSVRLSGSNQAWTSLPLTRTGAGTYAADFTAAPWQVGRAYDVRVTATDATGGALTQDTTRAFVIGS